MECEKTMKVCVRDKSPRQCKVVMSTAALYQIMSLQRKEQRETESRHAFISRTLFRKLAKPHPHFVVGYLS